MRAQRRRSADPVVLRMLLFADCSLMEQALTAALLSRRDVRVLAWTGESETAEADVALALLSGTGRTALPGARDGIRGLPLVVVAAAPGALVPQSAGEVVALDMHTSVVEIVDTARALVRRRALPRTPQNRSRSRPQARLRTPRSPHDRLTAREREVLTLISSGTTTSQIADSLAISRHTARTHVRNILDKLEVNSRLQAGAYAARNRLV